MIFSLLSEERRELSHINKLEYTNINKNTRYIVNKEVTDRKPLITDARITINYRG